MPYRDIRKQRQAVKEAVQKHRVLLKTDVIPDNVIPSDVIPYYPFMDWLIDPIKRTKLEKVCLSAKNHRTMDDIRLGVSGPTLTVMAELLDITA